MLWVTLTSILQGLKFTGTDPDLSGEEKAERNLSFAR
jgi:hypothetical protein